MTHTEINEAIAEHLYRGKGDLEIFLSHPHRPNYCNDLNAMHEAEKMLGGDQRFVYWHNLNSIVLGTVHVAFATAAQRAEAFLKTLNLWTHIKALQDWQFTFDNYTELDSDTYNVEIQVFRDYVDEHESEFNGEEDDLAWKIEDLILAAEPYFDAIYKQEQWDEERDQRAYLTSEMNH